MVKKTLSVKPIQKQKIPEIIISELKDIIDSGQIEPGDKLPPERDLAGMLNVSRSSLREALRSLSLLGILDNKSGKGTYLKTAPNRWPIEPFLIVSLESSNLLSMFEARHELELVVVQWAAERRTKSDLKKMEIALKKMGETIDQPMVFIDQEISFHKAIVNAAKNAIIADFMDVLYDQLRSTRASFYQSYSNKVPKTKASHLMKKGESWGPDNPQYLADLVKKHERIFDAIVKKDSMKAQKFADEHMQLEYFKKMIKENGKNK